MIQVSKIYKPIDLREYDAAYAVEVEALVNPPQEILQKRDALRIAFLRVRDAGMGRFAFLRKLLSPMQQANRRQHDLMAQMWKDFTTAEVAQLQEADPALFLWMVTRTWAMVADWRAAKKK